MNTIYILNCILAGASGSILFLVIKDQVVKEINKIDRTILIDWPEEY